MNGNGDDKPKKETVCKTSDPIDCSDCGHNPCVCHSYLPVPTIQKTSEKEFEISFGPEWTDLDREQYLRANGYSPKR